MNDVVIGPCPFFLNRTNSFAIYSLRAYMWDEVGNQFAGFSLALARNYLRHRSVLPTHDFAQQKQVGEQGTKMDGGI